MPRRTPPVSGLITLADAAAYLACNERSIRRRIAEGRLPAYRVGPRNIRVKLADLDALIERIPAGEAGE